MHFFTVFQMSMPPYTPTPLLEGNAHSITTCGYTIQNLTLFQQINLKALYLYQ